VVERPGRFAFEGREVVAAQVDGLAAEDVIIGVGHRLADHRVLQQRVVERDIRQLAVPFGPPRVD
jgi:hypothetical protein